MERGVGMVNMENISKPDIDTYLEWVAISINMKSTSELTITDAIQTLELKDFRGYSFRYLYFVDSLVSMWKTYCLYTGDDDKTYISYYLNYQGLEDALNNYQEGDTTLGLEWVNVKLSCTEEESKRLTQLIKDNQLGNLKECLTDKSNLLYSKVVKMRNETTIDKDEWVSIMKILGHLVSKE